LSQELIESWRRPVSVEHRFHFQGEHPATAFLGGFLEPLEHFFIFAEARADHGDAETWNILL
jgi:hypothetical protein